MRGHRTHTTGHAPERPVPYPESTTNAQGTGLTHRTRPEHPMLSVRVTCRSQTASDAPIGFNPRPVTSVRCLTLTGAGTDSTPNAQAQRPVPLRPASSEKHSHDFYKLSTSAIESMHYIFSKAPNPTKLERNPNPSLPFKLHLLLKVCQHHHVCTTNASVLAFSQSFSSKELS